MRSRINRRKAHLSVVRIGFYDILTQNIVPHTGDIRAIACIQDQTSPQLPSQVSIQTGRTAITWLSLAVNKKSKAGHSNNKHAYSGKDLHNLSLRI